MQLTLPIGKQSDNSVYSIDIAKTPHLFITYCEPHQLAQCLSSIAGIHEYGKLVIFYLSLHSRHHPLFKEPNFFQEVIHTYYTDKPTEGNLKSKSSFIQTLYKEYKRRRGLAPEKKSPPLIVVVDNIWDLLFRLTNRSSLQFLELLVMANWYGIHLVMASPTSYRNLLQQVMQLSPSHHRLLEQAKVPLPPAGITSVGAELIYTSEDMVFFKPQHSMEVQRFYKL